jgi:hypothetical protein
MILELFRLLGDRISREWQARGRTPDSFPELATRELAACAPAAQLESFDVLRWLLATPSLPPQRDLYGWFGSPTVQVYDGGDFYIEVLHWLDGTTEIHQHAFAGAFHVLAGSSIHALHRFDETQRHGTALRVGRLALQRVELLERGATLPIITGDAMIHSLFHLDRPSVTVVVRTPALAAARPQLAYWKPSLAVDATWAESRSERATRQLQAIGALAQLGHPDLEAMLASAIAGAAEPIDVVQLAIAAGRFARSEPALRALVEQARPRYGSLVDHIIDVAIENSRQQLVVQLRSRLHEREQRFFLALVLSFNSATEVLPLVRSAYPEADPEELMVRWCDGIMAALGPGHPAGRLFGLFFSAPAATPATD